jgi:uncharacterized damage-inducible protein DinB
VTSLLPRIDGPETGDERAMLDGFLDFQRSTIAVKASGLSDADAARSLLPSLTTVTGLVQHLADVERSWFLEDMLGLPIHTRYSEDDPDGEFRVDETTSLQDALDDYERACNEARQATARLPLEQLTTSRDGRFSLRWVILHMIEETARHAGHLDILREMLDGETGE